MKLATRRTSEPDGRLVVVSRDLTTVAAADAIAPNLQWALDRWDEVRPELDGLYDRLNRGEAPAMAPYDPSELAAPLPRAWQWLDASAFPTHGQLMERAVGHAPIESPLPLMYQGMSHRFLGPTEAVPFRSEDDGIDFEGELGVITGDVPMGSGADDAARRIRLAVQINDWSLRAIAPVEMKTGFGFIGAKPACSMAPVAVTLDELGDAWRDGLIEATLEVWREEERFGAVLADEMAYGFPELIAHAARTRDLCAGTLLGSGTVSRRNYAEAGSCCISERRAIEMIADGAPRTGFLKFGERVRMQARLANGDIPFGALDQRVVKAEAHR